MQKSVSRASFTAASALAAMFIFSMMFIMNNGLAGTYEDNAEEAWPYNNLGLLPGAGPAGGGLINVDTLTGQPFCRISVGPPWCGFGLTYYGGRVDKMHSKQGAQDPRPHRFWDTCEDNFGSPGAGWLLVPGIAPLPMKWDGQDALLYADGRCYLYDVQGRLYQDGTRREESGETVTLHYPDGSRLELDKGEGTGSYTPAGLSESWEITLEDKNPLEPQEVPHPCTGEEVELSFENMVITRITDPRGRIVSLDYDVYTRSHSVTGENGELPWDRNKRPLLKSINWNGYNNTRLSVQFTAEEFARGPVEEGDDLPEAFNYDQEPVLRRISGPDPENTVEMDYYTDRQLYGLIRSASTPAGREEVSYLQQYPYVNATDYPPFLNYCTPVRRYRVSLSLSYSETSLSSGTYGPCEGDEPWKICQSYSWSSSIELGTTAEWEGFIEGPVNENGEFTMQLLSAARDETWEGSSTKENCARWLCEGQPAPDCWCPPPEAPSPVPCVPSNTYQNDSGSASGSASGPTEFAGFEGEFEIRGGGLNVSVRPNGSTILLTGSGALAHTSSGNNFCGNPTGGTYRHTYNFSYSFDGSYAWPAQGPNCDFLCFEFGEEGGSSSIEHSVPWGDDGQRRWTWTVTVVPEEGNAGGKSGDEAPRVNEGFYRFYQVDAVTDYAGGARKRETTFCYGTTPEDLNELEVDARHGDLPSSDGTMVLEIYGPLKGDWSKLGRVKEATNYTLGRGRELSKTVTAWGSRKLGPNPFAGPSAHDITVPIPLREEDYALGILTGWDEISYPGGEDAPLTIDYGRPAGVASYHGGQDVSYMYTWSDPFAGWQSYHRWCLNVPEQVYWEIGGDAATMSRWGFAGFDYNDHYPHSYLSYRDSYTYPANGGDPILTARHESEVTSWTGGGRPERVTNTSGAPGGNDELSLSYRLEYDGRYPDWVRNIYRQSGDGEVLFSQTDPDPSGTYAVRSVDINGYEVSYNYDDYGNLDAVNLPGQAQIIIGREGQYGATPQITVSQGRYATGARAYLAENKVEFWGPDGNRSESVFFNSGAIREIKNSERATTSFDYPDALTSEIRLPTGAHARNALEAAEGGFNLGNTLSYSGGTVTSLREFNERLVLERVTEDAGKGTNRETLFEWDNPTGAVSRISRSDNALGQQQEITQRHDAFRGTCSLDTPERAPQTVSAWNSLGAPVGIHLGDGVVVSCGYEDHLKRLTRMEYSQNGDPRTSYEFFYDGPPGVHNPPPAQWAPPQKMRDKLTAMYMKVMPPETWPGLLGWRDVEWYVLYPEYDSAGRLTKKYTYYRVTHDDGNVGSWRLFSGERYKFSSQTAELEERGLTTDGSDEEFVTAYGYGPDARLHTLEVRSGSGSPESFVNDCEYNRDGVLDRIVGDGWEIRYSPDPYGRPQEFAFRFVDGEGQQREYEEDIVWNSANQIESKGPWVYGYDPLFRLTSATFQSQEGDRELGYEYDDFDNMHRKTENGKEIFNFGQMPNNQIPGWTYDGRGNARGGELPGGEYFTAQWTAEGGIREMVVRQPAGFTKAEHYLYGPDRIAFIYRRDVGSLPGHAVLGIHGGLGPGQLATTTYLPVRDESGHYSLERYLSDYCVDGPGGMNIGMVRSGRPWPVYASWWPEAGHGDIVNLKWDPAPDSDVSHYNMYYREGEGEWMLGGTATGAGGSILLPGHYENYSYAVEVEDTSGNRGLITEASRFYPSGK